MKRGRPIIPMPNGCNPFAGTLAALAERHGVSASTISKWRRENPAMRDEIPEPEPAPKAPGVRGRPMTRDEFAERLERRHSGSLDACASERTSTDVARDYGVTRQAVDYWRKRLEES